MKSLDFIALVIVLITSIFVLKINKLNVKFIQEFLNWFPAILFAYVIPAGFTHLFDLDLGQGMLHAWSRYAILPLTLLAVMASLPIRQLKVVGIRPLLLFFGGSLIIAGLPVFLVFLFSELSASMWGLFVREAYWKGLVPIVGGWIGGSTSQLILKELAETPENLFLSVLVLDNILVNCWTILMFQFIKKGEKLSLLIGIQDPVPAYQEGKAFASASLRPMRPAFILVILSVFVGLVYFLQLLFLFSVVLLSLLGLLLGNLIPNWNTNFSLKLGGLGIVLVMAILGLRLDFHQLSLPLPFVGLVILWLIFHFVGMIGIARLLNLNLIWVPIASMANLGGISTAPAVTAAYRKDLMPHAVLLAILSMVTGTGWGLVTIFLFQMFNL